jgi:hypothetical protein
VALVPEPEGSLGSVPLGPRRSPLRGWDPDAGRRMAVGIRARLRRRSWSMRRNDNLHRPADALA